MSGAGKAFRHRNSIRHATAVYVEDSAADAALEMVMMRLPGNFVARGQSGNLNPIQPLLGDKSMDISVDGSQSQPAERLFRGCLNLFCRQGPPFLKKSFADRILLPCLAFVCCEFHVCAGCSVRT